MAGHENVKLEELGEGIPGISSSAVALQKELSNVAPVFHLFLSLFSSSQEQKHSLTSHVPLKFLSQFWSESLILGPHGRKAWLSAIQLVL